MKLVLFSVFVSALVNAETASYSSNYASVKNSDPDVEIQQVEVIEIPWQGESETPPQGSYGPPQQEYEPPKQEYGPPEQGYEPLESAYGPPKPVYGPPPESTTTEWDISTTTEYPTTTEIIGNNTNITKTKFAKLTQDDLTERGEYYIYHPNGALQRVVYSTKDDVKNMAYSAQLRYQTVEPINGPIYTYDPETYIFRRVNK
ncbi:hypothetical protein NQ314_015636 [Rhamnusium bicolor]|uniref:DUF4794 domain-containing protein n=1 Tax=Rhamnusium bicolor TaxID=1586634 RepID=A0AAV8WXU2_9CUCU|nr:hypothetical protein NQ314_015636 [Rhamnusium bicolor]